MTLWYAVVAAVIAAVLIHLLLYLHRNHHSHHGSIVSMLKEHELFYVPGDDITDDDDE